MGFRTLTCRAPLPRAAWTAALGGALVALHSPGARADEPRKVTEPSVMREPTEIVQIADAFDDDDIFDLHLSLGYQHTWKNAKIYRETAGAQISTGGFTPSNMNVASYEQDTARLLTRADIGIYKDIAIVIRMPVILSDDRSLKENGGGLQSNTLVGAPGEQLFMMPFKSPTRSGIEYLALGMDFGLMNQARNPNKPTWIIGGEVRLDVSEPMHACNKKPTPLNLDPDVKQVSCAQSNDIDRDGSAPETDSLADGGYRDPASGVQLDE